MNKLYKQKHSDCNKPYCLGKTFWHDKLHISQKIKKRTSLSYVTIYLDLCWQDREAAQL